MCHHYYLRAFRFENPHKMSHLNCAIFINKTYFMNDYDKFFFDFLRVKYYFQSPIFVGIIRRYLWNSDKIQKPDFGPSKIRQNSLWLFCTHVHVKRLLAASTEEPFNFLFNLWVQTPHQAKGICKKIFFSSSFFY